MGRVVIDQKALRAHLRTPEPQDALDAVTGALVQAIEAESPVNEGYYQGSIRTRRFPLIRRIFSVDWAAHIIEWGGANAKGPGGGPAIAYAPFRRGARATGLPFDEAQKGETEVDL
jgi:hypothetical protein